MNIKVHKAVADEVNEKLAEIDYRVVGDEGSYYIYEINSEDYNLKKELTEELMCSSLDNDFFQIAKDIENEQIKRDYEKGRV